MFYNNSNKKIKTREMLNHSPKENNQSDSPNKKKEESELNAAAAPLCYSLFV